MNTQLLKKYKAKSDNTTIYHHNQDLQNVLNQLEKIHNISINNKNLLNNSISIHDIGKVVDSFQDNIESTHRIIRHEILSASCDELSDNERLLILLHHKSLEELQKYIDNEYLDKELEELKQKLNVDTIDINSYLKKVCRYNKKNISMLNDKELILNLGYLKLCDHIASAGIKTIDKGLNTRQVYKFDKYRSIQQKVLDLEENQDVIIQAPTGLGKTETSLLWSDLVQNEDKSRHIFYLLPYTASINALYKRLKNDKLSVGVLHSKIKSLLNKEDGIEDIKEELELFKKNIKQTTICTIFQLIKAMFQCKNFEMILAQLNNSIVIVDEVHCFDIENFTLLIETLKYLKNNFNINICIMSASIPNCLMNKIKQELNISMIINADKEDFLLRHKINYFHDTIDSKLNKVYNDLKNKKQVLLCVNSVDYSQELYRKLREKFPNKKIRLIHGRFNARDRTEHEKDLKDCDLLIGTQAIEVSLDIDYDVMYTEIAPLDALLQRFGRVNRKGKKGISKIYIFKQKNKSIYNKEIINSTEKVLHRIIDIDKGVIYESKVNTYLDLVYTEFDEFTYNEIKNGFIAVTNNLCIGYYNKNAIEQVINNKDTITALPISLRNEYITYKNNRQYIEANELVLSTYKNWGEYYYDKDLDLYISNFKYDGNIGLIKEIDIENQFI